MSQSLAILLVDDDKIGRYITRNMFKEISEDNQDLSLDIKEMEHGLEALDYLQSGVAMPDLILLDINMPYMDGFEFLRWLRSKKHYKNLKVVVCSTSLMPHDREKASKLGVQGFYIKPLNKPKLKECLALAEVAVSNRS